MLFKGGKKLENAIMSEGKVLETQRLRNLTTGRLHTKMGHIYQDMETLTGMEGIFTHMIPNISRAMEPWLKEQVKDERFWDDEHDTTHVGNYDIEPMTKDEQTLVMKRYGELPHPFAAMQN